MNRGVIQIFIASVLLSGCAVSANEFAPAALPQVERAAITINERAAIQIADPSVLSLRATVLGNTCSAVGVSGDFQARFGEVLNLAVASVFTGGAQAGATTISISVAPETPQVRLLRRSYMSGDARVDFAMAADVVVTRANGAREQFRVSADATRAQASEPTMSCDGAARALAAAFDESAIKLATEVRQSIISSEQQER